MGRKQRLSRKKANWDNPKENHRAIPRELKRYANRLERHSHGWDEWHFEKNEAAPLIKGPSEEE